MPPARKALLGLAAAYVVLASTHERALEMVPLEALVIPLFLMIFGVSDVNKVAIAAFGALLIVLFNSAYGVINARKQRVMAAKVMGATRWQTTRYHITIDGKEIEYTGSACVVVNMGSIGTFDIGFGDQVRAAVVQLDDDVMFGGRSHVLYPHVRAYFFLEFVQATVDLVEIPVDLVQLSLIEMIVRSRDTDSHSSS